MAKNKLNTQNIIILAGIGLAAYFIFKNLMKAPAIVSTNPIPIPDNTNTGTNTNPIQLPTGCNNKVTFDFANLSSSGIFRNATLHKGIYTLNSPIEREWARVATAYLQAWLNQKHNTCLEVDGIFGQLTEDALLSKTGKKEGTLNELNAVYQFGQGGALG